MDKYEKIVRLELIDSKIEYLLNKNKGDEEHYLNMIEEFLDSFDEIKYCKSLKKGARRYII